MSNALYSLFALRALLNALSPLIGHELQHSNTRVPVGWAANLTDDEVKDLGQKGREELENELEEVVLEESGKEYGRRMREVRAGNPYSLIAT